MVIEETSPSLVHTASQTKIPPYSEGDVLVGTDTREKVQLRPLLNWEALRAWKATSGIMDEFLNMSFNFMVFNTANAPLSLTKHRKLPHHSPLSNPLYTINLMSFLRTSRASHYLRASTSITIRLTPACFNRRQTMSRSLKKMKRGSTEIEKMRSSSLTSTENTGTTS